MKTILNKGMRCKIVVFWLKMKQLLEGKFTQKYGKVINLMFI